jgi:hypothetical protein
MIYVSILTSDRNLDAELWAIVWNRRLPADLQLLHAYNLAGNKRLFVWETDSVAGLQFMDAFNYVGELVTYPAFDRTSGWMAAFASDIEAFRQANRDSMRRSGVPEAEIEGRMAPNVELRGGAMAAANMFEARRFAREWQARQAGEGSS